MKFLRQTAHAFGIGIATTAVRPRHTLLTAFGLLVAGVTLLVLLTIPAGLKQLAGQTGLPDVVLILPSHSINETGGSLKPELAQLIGSLPGVAHTAGGEPMVAPQLVVDARLRRTDGTTATVLVRGVSPMFWNLLGNSVKLKSGERPQSGNDQVLAGSAAARGFLSLHTNDNISIHNTPWHVSGEFTAGGGFWGSELWADQSALQSVFNAQGNISSVWVKLVSPAAFATFSKAMNADPRLKSLQVFKQRKYYARQTVFLDLLLRAGIMVVAIVLGLGAILATINALGMALAARRRELAVMRAVGFSRGSLAVALILEVVAIGVACTGIVALLGWMFVNGYEVGSSTAQSAIQFQLHVGAEVVWRTLVYLLVLAVVSAVWPVWSAVRAPLIGALHNE